MSFTISGLFSNKAGSDSPSLTDTLISHPPVREDNADSEDDEDEDGAEDEAEAALMNHMAELFIKAKLSARNKSNLIKTTDQLKDQAELVLFGAEEDDTEEESKSGPSGYVILFPHADFD